MINCTPPPPCYVIQFSSRIQCDHCVCAVFNAAGVVDNLRYLIPLISQSDQQHYSNSKRVRYLNQLAKVCTAPHLCIFVTSPSFSLLFFYACLQIVACTIKIMLSPTDNNSWLYAYIFHHTPPHCLQYNIGLIVLSVFF